MQWRQEENANRGAFVHASALSVQVGLHFCRPRESGDPAQVTCGGPGPRFRGGDEEKVEATKKRSTRKGHPLTERGGAAGGSPFWPRVPGGQAPARHPGARG